MATRTELRRRIFKILQPKTPKQKQALRDIKQKKNLVKDFALAENYAARTPGFMKYVKDFNKIEKKKIRIRGAGLKAKRGLTMANLKRLKELDREQIMLQRSRSLLDLRNLGRVMAYKVWAGTFKLPRGKLAKYFK